jgi:hypothetical protein
VVLINQQIEKARLVHDKELTNESRLPAQSTQTQTEGTPFRIHLAGAFSLAAARMAATSPQQ